MFFMEITAWEAPAAALLNKMKTVTNYNQPGGQAKKKNLKT
jgi:hypothetical protein